VHVKVGKRPRPGSRIVRIARKLSLLSLDPFPSFHQVLNALSARRARRPP
jgi:hypothetical protein